MNARAERIGRNEALFREVNERIRELQEQFTVPPPLEVVCECGDETCTERLGVPVDVYEEVRASGGRFVVAPGHVAPDVESVVERHRGFDVLRKDPGGPAQLAEATDPRD